MNLRNASTLPAAANTDGPGPSDNPLLQVCSGSSFTFSYEDERKRIVKRTVNMLHVLFRSDGIIGRGRGTIVVRVKCACVHCSGQCDWAGRNLILKISFLQENRASEKTFMDFCRDKAVGEHAWVLNHLPRIYCSFEMPFDVCTARHKLETRFQDKCEMRILRGSIQEELQPLSELRTGKEFAQVYFDVVQCHHWVYTYPKILHRDISDGNIMFREEEGKIYGVLNDWDLALLDPETEKSPTSKFRTGTKPFLAHEQHDFNWTGPHRYRHDMESMFYVILFQSCLYSGPRATLSTEPIWDNHHIEEWHQEDDFELWNKKQGLINNAKWKPPVQDFFEPFSFWLSSIQRHLYLGFMTRTIRLFQQNALATSGHSSSQTSPAYDDVTLDNNFSYDEVVIIMHRYDEEPLEIRGNEWQQRLVRE
ncbi:protein kinase [Lentinula raphanica]|nr:protein kinase [Lentinula raphanica]